MKRIRIRTPAKINLHLRVLGRRADGYHELETLFQAIDLWDELELSESHGDTVLEVPGHRHLQRPDNLVLRAMRWLEEHCGTRLPARMRLIKRIPEGAGLGGGSSDAAATLIAASELFRLDLSKEALHKAAVALGADVPFFLDGGTALGEGVGDRLTRVATETDYELLLVNPGFPVSTAKVFSQMSKTLTEAPDRVNLSDVLKDGAAVEDLLFNDLQSVAEELYPEINQARTFLEEITESPTLMTGSGPTVFSLMRAAARDNERIEHRCPGNWWSKRARPVCAGPVLE